MDTKPIQLLLGVNEEVEGLPRSGNGHSAQEDKPAEPSEGEQGVNADVTSNPRKRKAPSTDEESEDTPVERSPVNPSSGETGTTAAEIGPSNALSPNEGERDQKRVRVHSNAIESELPLVILAQDSKVGDEGTENVSN